MTEQVLSENRGSRAGGAAGPNRVGFQVGGAVVDLLSLDAAVACVEAALGEGRSLALFTLNLDHAVKIRSSAAFAEAYRRADHVSADGFPIVFAGTLLGHRVSRATGADLVVPAARVAAALGRPVMLCGSTTATVARAAEALGAAAPRLIVADAMAPSMRFDPFGAEATALIERIRASGAGLVFLAFGAPKQEFFAIRAREECPGVVFLPVGAALDFLAGEQRRAPPWMRRAHLEWAFRLGSDPRRLGPRYAQCLALAPVLFADALRRRLIRADEA
jgi:exopolysaccharide biosynthesis WecB/TagA/CpsF family protein